MTKFIFRPQFLSQSFWTFKLDLQAELDFRNGKINKI